ncbi:MAG: hypothetical protein NTV51_20045 [Verrucomicrobia bacterium]|nr:hypothetical protein [Verrucomicrobiota bacterium]
MDGGRDVPRASVPGTTQVRACYFNAWAQGLEPAADYLARLPTLDLRPLVADPRDASLLTKARLDCDWYGENARAFAAMAHAGLEFLPAWVCGIPGLLDLVKAPRAPGEERWLIVMAHQPQALKATAGKLFGFLRKQGVRILYYAFDEASREMPCFREIAPHLDVLIHDESPLDAAGAAWLRADCRTLHRSWVANTLPFATPFVEAPEENIVFLGSEMGLTPHRRRQIDFLRAKFGTRFTAIHDHSLPVGERHRLAERFKVSLCPEGRKFATRGMSATHTDRPFWSGCLGLVPVSEDSAAGGRLEDLHREALLLRYPHGDLAALATACERALTAPVAERRRIYDYYNRHETVGTVVAAAMAAAG